MPLYKFQCKCGLRFEEVVDKDVKTSSCQKCGKPAERMLSAPDSVKFEAGLPSAELDRKIGSDAEAAWNTIGAQWHAKRDLSEKEGRTKAVKGGETQEQKRAEITSEYSQALKAHRERRTARGIGQFDKDVDPKLLYE